MATIGEQDWQERYHELATMAGQLAHELRNPLSALTLNLGILLQDLDPPRTPREHRMRGRLVRMRQECNALEDLLKGFLQFVRAEEHEEETLCLNDLVRRFVDYFRPVAEAAGVELVAHLDNDLAPVTGSPPLLQQMLQNLVQNGLQAMPEGGRIEILTRRCADAVELRVIDSGPGIPTAIREKVFDPFFSTRRDGTGLGLSIVRRIVRAHNATIDCESEEGRGTCFVIRFPTASVVTNPT